MKAKKSYTAICTQCGEEFTISYNTYIFRKKSNKDVNICIKCTRKNLAEQRKETNLKNNLLVQKTFTLNCKVCGKEFKLKRSAYNIRIKLGKNDSICTKCSNRLANSKPMELKKVKNYIITCSECKENFIVSYRTMSLKMKNKLDINICQHCRKTVNPKVYTSVCKSCGKTFSLIQNSYNDRKKSNADMNLCTRCLVYSKEKYFTTTCKECGKKFYLTKKLYDKRIKSGRGVEICARCLQQKRRYEILYTFKCKICGESFALTQNNYYQRKRSGRELEMCEHCIRVTSHKSKKEIKNNKS